MTVTMNTLVENGYMINNQICLVHTSPNVLLCTIENRSTGNGHSAHPNIDTTGSVAGMIRKGYWNQADKIYTFGGFKYNISRTRVSDELDLLALHIQNGLDLWEHATGHAFSLLPIA